MRARACLAGCLILASAAAGAHSFDPFAAEKQAQFRAVVEPLRRGDAHEALIQADQAIERFSRHAPFHVLRAQILLKLGRTAPARSAIEQAIALAPEEPLAYWVRGVIHLLERRPAQALADFDRVLSSDDLDRALSAQAIGSRGMALTDLGRHAEALQDLDRALKLRPEAFAERQFRAAALVALGRWAPPKEGAHEAVKSR